MKRAAAIFLLIYFAFGNLVLPFGDFSILPELPKMYSNCKATEHHDMNPFDFITDHLINIDGLFDAHDNGDEQKPHQPFPLQHHNFQVQYCLPALPEVSLERRVAMPLQKRILPIHEAFALSSAHLGCIFKPPILA